MLMPAQPADPSTPPRNRSNTPLRATLPNHAIKSHRNGLIIRAEMAQIKPLTRPNSSAELAYINLTTYNNLNTHTLGSLYEAFEPAKARALAERLEIHYTPPGTAPGSTSPKSSCPA